MELFSIRIQRTFQLVSTPDISVMLQSLSLSFPLGEMKENHIIQLVRCLHAAFLPIRQFVGNNAYQ